VLQQPAGNARPAATAPQPIAPAPAAAAPRLDLVTVQKGDLQATVEASGKLQLYQYVDVSSQIAGQVKDVLVAVGDNVKAGALLVEISPTVQPSKVESQRAQMARLQAELADQRAQLDYAELQFKRQTQLKAQNATREEAFESSKMNVSSATARVDSINAQIRQVEANLKIDEDSRQHAQVAAPMAGTVVSLNAHAGQLVGTGQGQAPLLRIADQSKMTVQARVAEVDVTRLRKGMAAQFSTPGYPGQHWSGKLRQVLPMPADNSGEQGKETFYNVLFEVNNPDQQLMSGMSAQVHFVVGQASDTLLLPARALGTPEADGSYNVTVIDAARKPSVRRVKTGMRNAQQVQVLSGLAAGEQVLVGKMPAATATAAVKGVVAS
jgi:macrolide-specific efflux system membrane fusion protein